MREVHSANDEQLSSAFRSIKRHDVNAAAMIVGSAPGGCDGYTLPVQPEEYAHAAGLRRGRALMINESGTATATRYANTSQVSVSPTSYRWIRAKPTGAALEKHPTERDAAIGQPSCDFSQDGCFSELTRRPPTGECRGQCDPAQDEQSLSGGTEPATR